MTIKYLAGNRVQGTSYDRFAITGKAFGPETYSGGGSAQAINFDGSNDYMVIGSRTDFKFLHDGSSWSIRVRILPDSQSGGFTILNTSGDGGGAYFNRNQNDDDHFDDVASLTLLEVLT